MRILVIGDVIGNIGVKKIKEVIPNFKKENHIDFIIVNAENSAEGMGITAKIFEELKKSGVNVMTMGNHTWGKREIFNIIDEPELIRPANYAEKVPGKGVAIYQCKDKNIAVINLIGRVDMNVLSENPFTMVEKIVEEIKEQADIIIIDFHAEATAEKIAMGYFLDGKVTCIYGTHTHVATADEKILPKGTAYITDIGMTGPEYSVIGMDVEASLKRFVTTLPERYKVSDDKKANMQGIILDIDDENCRMNKIQRIKL